MECKCKTVITGWYDADSELIDTLWNVNEEKWIVSIYLMFELIDTLWNVNEELNEMEAWALVELIDTLWNVN